MVASLYIIRLNDVYILAIIQSLDLEITVRFSGLDSPYT